MIGTESPDEIAACVCLAIALFGASAVPFFLLLEERHLTPRWLRRAAARAWLVVLLAWDRARIAAIDGLLFLLRLAAPKGAAR